MKLYPFVITILLTILTIGCLESVDEMLELLDTGDVEIHQAKAAFTADGNDYPVGSWVVLLAQPSGAYAKTMLEKQVYPDLRYFEGGPPIPPYDVTAQTLGMLMGVEVSQVEGKFEADLELLEAITPPPALRCAATLLTASATSSVVPLGRMC